MVAVVDVVVDANCRCRRCPTDPIDAARASADNTATRNLAVMPSAHKGLLDNIANEEEKEEEEEEEVTLPLLLSSLSLSNHDLAGEAMNPTSRRTTAGSSPASPPSRHVAASVTPSRRELGDAPDSLAALRAESTCA